MDDQQVLPQVTTCRSTWISKRRSVRWLSLPPQEGPSHGCTQTLHDHLGPTLRQRAVAHWTRTGAYLPADIYVRYLRGRGRDVVWICSSDEHGAAIAKKEGTTPREIVDRYHGQISKAFKDFGLEFDLYHRTSSEEHHANAQAFFTQLNNQGSFEVKTSEQYYDAAQQQFLADRYITGECPNCSPNAYGDQCERCGKDLSPIGLINPKSTLSGEAPELRETSLWYLPMDRHEVAQGMGRNRQIRGQSTPQPADWKPCIGPVPLMDRRRTQGCRAMTETSWGVPFL